MRYVTISEVTEDEHGNSQKSGNFHKGSREMIPHKIKKYDGLTDGELLTLLSERNEIAFRELYHRYWEDLYHQSKSVLRDRIAAEDVVQDIFIDLWNKNDYTHIENFPAYIHQSVRYKTLMTLRKNRITDRHLEIYKEILPAKNTDPERKYIELREEINYYLDQLPPRCREVFYKSRFENMKNQEIADQLNISKRTVETHISHALRYLKGIKELLVFIFVSGILG